jgi:hypothetical protein
LGVSVLMVSNYSIYLLSLFHPVLLVRIAFYRLNRVTRCPEKSFINKRLTGVMDVIVY